MNPITCFKPRRGARPDITGKASRARTSIAGIALLAGCSHTAPITKQSPQALQATSAPAQTEAPAPAAPPISQIQSPTSPSHPTSSLKEVFKSIRLDAKQRLIELDGTVPIDAH